ncbi:MAG: CRISPR-associated endonuclease Cas3'' [Firmicutes bacterium]|nr:CRISPR-associated endonuclease Cas3'' [Bacillota bacterium]
MNLLAHITKIDDKRIDQTLMEHCVNTAQFGADSLEDSGFYNTVKLACLLHDMGKAKAGFNEYMESGFNGEEVKRGAVNHTFAGVIYLLEKYHDKGKMEKLTSEIVAYAIGAHHGLFDCIDLDGENGFVHRLEKSRNDIFYEESLQGYFREVEKEEEIDEYFGKAVGEIKEFYIKAQKLAECEKDSNIPPKASS